MPTAGPATAATMGFGNSLMYFRKRNTGGSSPPAPSLGGFIMKSIRSLPAVNTSVCPWITATRTLSSVAAACS